MYLADAFIQSDLHCIQVTVSTFDQLLLSLGIEPMIYYLSYRKARNYITRVKRVSNAFSCRLKNSVFTLLLIMLSLLVFLVILCSGNE